jgi:hypothetical protein
MSDRLILELAATVVERAALELASALRERGRPPDEGDDLSGLALREAVFSGAIPPPPGFEHVEQDGYDELEWERRRDDR